MSHLSRCPACATTFRVVDEQLQQAGGWVRCGTCQHVYDALPGLQADPVEPAMPEAAAVPATEPPPVDAHAQRVWVDESLLAATAPAPLAADPSHKPAFVRQAERRAFWRRPAVRMALGLCTLVAWLGVGLQAAWLWRDTLSVRWPATQPWLLQLCQPLGCTVAPPRLPQALSIDSSALLRDGEPGRYTFDLVVKNSVPHAVAAPALELTLLDSAQAVRLRRVFPAAEWPAARTALAAGEAWSVRFELALDPAIDSAMAGYRAWLFYP